MATRPFPVAQHDGGNSTQVHVAYDSVNRLHLSKIIRPFHLPVCLYIHT